MLKFLFLPGMIALAIGIILSFFGEFHPIFDTGANFRLHMSIMLFLATVIWIAKGSRFSGAILAAIASIAVYSTADSLPIGVEFEKPAGSKKIYRLLHLNLYYENATPHKVFELINETEPDFIFLNEYSPVWKNKFGTRLNSYSNRSRCTEPNGYGGTIILSKIPFNGGQEFCHYYAALNMKSVTLEGVPVTLGSVHLRWPWPASGPKQVTEMLPTLASLQENALIAGDFNSTPWTYLVRRFAQSGGLAIVKWIGPTWVFRMLPTEIAKYTGLPLDNVMYKGAVKIVEARTLQPVGSDHLPVLVRFYIEE